MARIVFVVAMLAVTIYAAADWHRTPEAPKRPSAPDDDPEFLFRLERDIQRKRREEERRAQEQRKHSEDEGTNPAEDSGDEAN